MVAAIWTARMANLALGGAFFTPWNIGDLPGEWVDALVGAATKPQRVAEAKAKIAERLAAWRNGLPQNRR